MSDSTEKFYYGSTEATHELLHRLKVQIDNIDAVRKTLMSATMDEEDSRWTVIIPLLLLIQKSCDSIGILAHADLFTNCLVSARCTLEATINVGYICSAGGEAADKASRHATQKSYRDMTLYFKMKSDFLGETTPAFSPEDLPSKLKEVIDEFSTSKAKELPYWTPLSLNDRIGEIRKSYGNKVAQVFDVCVSAIFRKSSEILHGTYYGALYGLGQVPSEQPISSPDDLVRWYRENTSTVMCLMIVLLSVIIEVLATHFELDELVKSAKAEVDRLDSTVSFERHTD